MATVEDQFHYLLAQEPSSPEAFVSWLKEVSQFYDAIEEATTGHYIDFQAFNQDEAAKRIFEYDQEKIEPLVKRYQSQLDEKIFRSPLKDELDEAEYGRFLASKQNALELYNEANVALEVEEDKLATRYFEITGNLTADWDGEEKTIIQLFPYLEDPDQAIRKQAFTLIFDALLNVQADLQDIMDQLLSVREKKARNSQLPNYRDYMFKKYERFDYTPDDVNSSPNRYAFTSCLQLNVSTNRSKPNWGWLNCGHLIRRPYRRINGR